MKTVSVVANINFKEKRIIKMKSKKFTLIELLVVITIIAILAAMLFPQFGKMQRKAKQNNSMSLCKQHGNSIAGYFTDVRRKNLPDLTDIITRPSTDWGGGGNTPSESVWNLPAGGRAFGYPRAQFNLPAYTAGDTSDRFAIFDTIIASQNVTGGVATSMAYADNGWQINKGRNRAWMVVQNESSAILTTKFKWTKTQAQKPVAYGDSHAGVTEGY
jgi:prepilin-type N-terminal cleavage/methylation domain-containing protein